MSLKRKIIWDNSEQTVNSVSEALSDIAVHIEQTVSPALTNAVAESKRRRIRTVPAPTRSGNGHKALKTRDLESLEKNKIETKLFIPNNGCIGPDMCVEFKMKHLPDDVAIFQITGYVTALHGKVARGKMHLQNMEAYETFIRTHRSLWRTFDSPKYRSMRALPPVNRHRQPRFAAVSAHR